MRRRLVIDTSLTGFTKTGESRSLLLPGKIAEELAEHLAHHSTPTDPGALMFPKLDGTSISIQGWRRTFHRAARRAGIGQEFTPNDLRHTAASWAIAHGANIYDVQNMLGHAQPSITLDVYGEQWEAGAERLADRLDAVLRAEPRVPADAAVAAIH
jgi:integrase